MGQQHRLQSHGRGIRALPRRPRHRHDGDGGILPLRQQGVQHLPVHSLGHALSDHDLAALPGVRRAGHGGREPLDAAGKERDLRAADRIRKTHFPAGSADRASALHRLDGCDHDGRGFHLRRRWAGPVKRACHRGIRHERRRADPADHPGDRPGLELLQAPAGNGGTLHRGRRALLHLAAGLLHGSLEINQQRVPLLVPDGGLAASAAGHERLVPAGL